MCKIDNTDITDYLAEDGYDVEWYDLSYDAGRQANGQMHMNIVATKYKIILHTKSLSQTQFQTFFTKIRANSTYSVNYFNPYTGEYRTATCYRGDRKTTVKWDRTDVGMLLNPTDISLIEL